MAKLRPLPGAPAQDEETPLAPLPTDAAAQQAPIDPGTEGFRAVVGGARDIGQGLLDTVTSLPDPVSLGESLIRSGLAATGLSVSTKPEDQFKPQSDKEPLKKLLTLTEVEENQSTVGAVSRELVKWVGGTVLLRKIPGVAAVAPSTSAALKAKLAFESVESAVAGYIFTDPHAKNLGNLIENVPMMGPVADLMAQDDNDSDFANKARGALENLIFAPLVTPVVHYLGAWRKAAKLKAVGKLDEAVKVMDDAQPQLEEAMVAARTAEVPENLIATQAEEVVQPAAGEAATAKKYTVETATEFKGKPLDPLMEGEVLAAKDSSGKVIGSIWVQEADGGFMVKDVRTGTRGTGAARELYQAAAEKYGPYKELGTQTDEGRAMVARLKETNPEIFTDPKTLEGVTRVADKPGIMNKMRLTRTMGEDGAFYELEGTLNYAKLGDDASIKQAISDTVSMVKRDLPGTVGTVQTMEETIALARYIGKDPNELFQSIAQMRMETGGMAAHIVGGRALIQRIGKDVYALGTKLDTLGGTDADRAGFAHMVDLLASTIDHVSVLRTEAARATKAGSYKVGMLGITTDSLADLVEKVGGGEYVMAMAKRIRMSGPNAVGTAILPPKNVFQKAIGIHNYVWMNGLLSGLKTTLVNVSTTAFNSGAMPGFRMIGGLLQEIGDNELGRDQMLRGFHQYRVLHSTIFDSLKLAKKAWDANSSLLDMASSPLEQAARLDPISETHLIQKAGAQWIGTLVGLPGRFLSTQDEFFKQVVYRSHVQADAWVDGLKQGLDGVQLQEFVDQRMLASVNEFGKALDNEALTAAKMATFTSDLNAKGWLLDRSLAEMAQQGLHQHPLVKGFILPFLRVPTNLFRQAWDMTPGLNLLRKQWVTDVQAGGEAGAMALGKMGAGTMFWSAAGILAYQGRLTGGGPKDPILRAQLGADWKPYSFVTYNDDGSKNYTSFARFDPFSYFFGFAADAAEVSGKLKDEEWDEVMTRAGMALMHNMSSKTYMRSIMDGLEALSGDEPAAKSWVRGRVASYVPGIVQTLQTDDEVKSLRTWFDGFRARVPGFADPMDLGYSSRAVESKRDNFGEKVLSPMGYPYTAVNPFIHFRGTNDPVRLELVGLTRSDSEARFALPSPILLGGNQSQQIDLRDIKSSKGQSFYDRWLERHADLRVAGMTLHESLAKLFASDIYMKARAAHGTGDKLYKQNSLALDLIDTRMDLYKNRALYETKKEFAAEGKDVGKALLQYEIGKATTRVRGSGTAPNINQLRELAGQN